MTKLPELPFVFADASPDATTIGLSIFGSLLKLYEDVLSDEVYKAIEIYVLNHLKSLATPESDKLLLELMRDQAYEQIKNYKNS